MKNFSAFSARKMNVRSAGIAVKKLIKRFPRAAFAVSLDFSLGFKLGKIPVNRAFADFLSALRASGVGIVRRRFPAVPQGSAVLSSL